MADPALPTDAEIEELAAELNIPQEDILRLFRHVGVGTDLQATMDLQLSTGGPEGDGFGLPEPGQRTTASLSLKILREHDAERFRAVWAIIAGGNPGSGDVEYADAHTAWIEGGADPALLAQRFGFDVEDVAGGTLGELSDDDFDRQLEERTKLSRSFTNQTNHESFTESANKELTYREASDGEREILDNIREEATLEESMAEAEQESDRRRGIGSQTGLFTPREMDIISGYLQSQRGFFEGADSPSISNLLRDPNILGSLAGNVDPSRLDPGLIGARMRLQIDPREAFRASDQEMISTMSAGPLPFMKDQLNRQVGEARLFADNGNDLGGSIVEPVESRIGAGGFQTEQQTLQRFDQGMSTLDELRSLWANASEETVENIQRQLWQMGYYGEDAIVKGHIPRRWGSRDARSNQAFHTMLYDLAASEHQNYNLLRNQRIREFSGIFRELKNDLLDIGADDPELAVDVAGIKEEMHVLSDEDTEDLIQEKASSKIGKKVDREMLKAILEGVREVQRAELDQRVSHDLRAQEADRQYLRQVRRRARYEANSGQSRLYDERGYEITPTVNPNRGFEPDLGLTEPVPGYDPTGEVNPEPLPGDSTLGSGEDYMGQNVVSMIERAPTPGAFAARFLRQNQGSQVFARDVARSIAVLRGMTGNTIPGRQA